MPLSTTELQSVDKILSPIAQVSSVQSLLRIKLCQSTFMLSKVLLINTVNTPQVLPTKIDHLMLDLTNELHLLHCHGASLLSDTRLKFSAMHSLPAATPTSSATPTRAAVVARNILMVEVAMQTKLDDSMCCRARCGFLLEKIKQKCFFVVNFPVKTSIHSRSHQSAVARCLSFCSFVNSHKSFVKQPV